MGGFLKTTLCTSAGVSGIGSPRLYGRREQGRSRTGGGGPPTVSGTDPGGVSHHNEYASDCVMLRRISTAINSTINPRSSLMDPRFRGGMTLRTALRGGSVVE